MINLSSIIALLQIALSFLISANGTALQPQATELAQQAINIASQALSKGNIQSQAIGSIPIQTEVKVDAIIITDEMKTKKIIAPIITSAVLLNNEEYVLDFFKPIAERYIVKTGYENDPQALSAFNPGWNLNDTDGSRNLVTNQLEKFPSVYMQLIITDKDKNPVNDELVTIETTDPSQNKNLDLTINKGKKPGELAGNIWKRKPDGTIFVLYPFTYFLKNTGQHTITFKVGTSTKSINLYRD